MMADARAHYVYVHKTPADGRVFYVGKGKGRRAWSERGRSRHWRHVVNKHGFEASIVRRDMPEGCALTFEMLLIEAFGFHNLTNATLGGGGITGWKHSDETKRRIGETQKGRVVTDKMRAALKKANANKVFRPETLAKMSAAAKARPRQTRSAETRAKIAASHIGIRPSPETLLKMSLSKIGKAIGRDNPTYDHTIRQWRNDDGRQYTGTRGDFIAQFDLANSCVCSVIKGRQKSVKGWRLI
ncbi:MAG: NUMOD3 domain-containing DNA-binding protein [Pseudomonadota bacterium]